MERNRRSFKKGLSFSGGMAGRRKREKTMLTIRKSRRERDLAQLRAQRRPVVDDGALNKHPSAVVGVLQPLVETLKRPNKESGFEAVAKIRAMINEGEDNAAFYDEEMPEYPLIWQQLCSVIPQATEMLRESDKVARANAAFLLRFISSCDFAHAIVQQGALERCVEVVNKAASQLPRNFSEQSTEFIQHALWCIGNCACESAQGWQAVLSLISPLSILPFLALAAGRSVDLPSSTPSQSAEGSVSGELSPEEQRGMTLARAAAWALRHMVDSWEDEGPRGSSVSSWRKSQLASLTEGRDSADSEVSEWRRVVGATAAVLQAAPTQSKRSGKGQTMEIDASIAPWRTFQIQTGLPPPNDVAVARFLRDVDALHVQMMDVDINFATGERDTFICRRDALQPMEELQDEEDEEDLETVDDLALTQADCAWALAHMSTEEGEQIVNELRRRDVGSTVTQLLYRYSSPLLLAPLLRILGNIVASSAFELPSMESMRDDEAGRKSSMGVGQEELNSIMNALTTLLHHPNKNIREEVCWTASNVAASRSIPVSIMFQKPQLLQRIVEQLVWADWDVRVEAAWTYCNLIVRISEGALLQELLSKEALGAMADMLMAPDAQIVAVILEAAAAILATGSRSETRKYGELLEECGVKDAIEELTVHPVDSISSFASQIADQYFKDDEEDASADPNALPARKDGQFVFGAQQASRDSQPATTFNFSSLQNMQE